MNSGATLLGYRQKYSTKEFYQRRLKKAAIPLIIWSVLYYFYDLRWTAFPGPIPHQQGSILDFLRAFATNHINNTFWFLYVILFLYVVTPIISKLSKRKMLILAGAVFILFDGLVYFTNICGYHSNQLDDYYHYMQYVADLGYFIIGYLIKEEYFSRKMENIIVIIGMFMMLGTVVNATLPQSNPYLSFSPLMYSIGLYILVRRVVKKLNPSLQVKDFFAKAASVSLGIYVTHPLMYHLFTKIIPVDWTNQIYIWLMPLLTYVIGGVILFWLKKLKFLRVLFP